MKNEREESQVRDAEEIDLGEPIAALAGFERDVSSNLASRIRRTIHRRITAGQVASFSASIPLLVLREFWSIVMGRLNPVGTRKDASHGKKTS
jgi:hypothetical protein